MLPESPPHHTQWDNTGIFYYTLQPRLALDITYFDLWAHFCFSDFVQLCEVWWLSLIKVINQEPSCQNYICSSKWNISRGSAGFLLGESTIESGQVASLLSTNLPCFETHFPQVKIYLLPPYISQDDYKLVFFHHVLPSLIANVSLLQKKLSIDYIATLQNAHPPFL